MSAMPAAVETASKTLDIFAMGGRFYLWDQDAALELRMKRRMMGNFVGRRRPGGKQEQDAVFPVMLLPEEATLAVEHSWARIVRQRVEGGAEGRGEERRIGEEEDSKQREQGSIALQSQHAAGSVQRLAPEDGGGGGGGGEGRKGWGRVEIPLSTGPRTLALSSFSSSSLPPSSSSLPLPLDPLAPRYLLFRALWVRGFWLTDALKFGADFLAYPGDPRDHHAQYLVTTLDPLQSLSARALGCGSRVAEAARKRLLLASLSSNRSPVLISVGYCGSLSSAKVAALAFDR